MAGRKGAIPLENLKHVICKYKYIFNTSIPPITHNIYICLQQELREQLNCNMNNKAIQICIKRHKNYFFDSDNIKLSSESCQDDGENDFLNVTFEISHAEYLNIVPQNSIYRLVPNKWTNELQDQISFKTDIACTFSFKNSYVPADINFNDIKCVGTCTQCDATLSLSISPSSQNWFKVTCKLRNYDVNFPHDPLTKNRLTSDRVNKIKEKLK